MTRSMTRAIAEREMGIRRRDRHEFTDAEREEMMAQADSDPWGIVSPVMDRRLSFVDHLMDINGTTSLDFDDIRRAQEVIRRVGATAMRNLATPVEAGHIEVDPYGPIVIGGDTNDNIHIRGNEHLPSGRF